MQYKSPLKELGFSNNDVKRDPLLFSFNVLKKKMMAEFELSRKVTIKLPLGEVSKNDLLVYFENIQPSFTYHIEILKDPGLVLFLEKNEPGFFNNNPLYQENNFREFIAPYFAYAYCQLALQLITNQKQSVSQFSDLQLIFPVNVSKELFRSLTNKIREYINEVNEIAELIKNENGVKPAGIYFQIYGLNTIEVLNRLNEEIFKEDIDAYLNASLRLVRACLNEMKNGYRNEEVVQFILARISKTNTNPSFSHEIGYLSSLISKKSEYLLQEEQNSTSNTLIGLAIIGGAIYLIIKFTTFLFRTLAD
jgi:hypothetical protein